MTRWSTSLGVSTGFGVLVGTALWLSLGTLDAYTGSDGPVRLAMLPSPWWWLVLTVVATTGLTTLALWLGRGPEPRRLATALAPLSGLVALVLPYTPWLPDLFPVLTIFAGPGRWIAWLVVAIETTRRLVRVSPLGRLEVPSRATPIAVLLLGALASGLGAAALTGTAVFPGGDEPHYLVMAQSLGRDGDLAIENNHERGDYREYFRADPPLAPHYLTRGVDDEIYSVHPVGLSVMLAPVYAAGGYTAVRAWLVVVSAATGALLVAWLRRLGLPASAAFVAWVAVYSSTPFFFFSFAVYPEMTAGLVVLIAMSLLEGRGHGSDVTSSRPADHLAWVGVGAAAGWLPWLSSKYAPLAAAVLLVAVGRITWPDRPRVVPLRRVWKPLLALLLPLGTSVLAWLGFFAVYWGTPWPGAPYGGDPQTHPSRLPVGIPGLFFDQEYGVLPYAPAYALALAGSVAMWRSGGRARRLACELALMVVALVGTVGAFHIWWGGTSPPGRPVVSVLPLLGVPMAWLYARLAPASLARGLTHALVTVGVGVTALLAFAEEGLLLVNQRDGTSSLLAYLSPVWELPAMFPTLIGDTPGVALRAVALWVGVAAATAWLLAGSSHWLRPVLTRTAIVVVALVVLSLAVPVATGQAIRTNRLDERSRIALLDRFDATRWPTALVFDPWSTVSASDLVGLPSFVVAPAVPATTVSADGFLYGRRLSLPAGVYEVEVIPSDPAREPLAGSLAVMVGRYGTPFAQWTVLPDATGRSRHTFALQVDAGYLGLQASPDLVRAEPTIRLSAIRVTDAHRRPEHDQVVATLHTPTATYSFLDWYVWPETRTFWTRPGRATRFLVSPAATGADGDSLTATPIESVAAQLRIRCGPIANEVEVISPRGRERIEVAAGAPALVTVSATGDVIPVEIRASSGFVPMDVDARSTDDRQLGCRIAHIEWTTDGAGSTQ